MTDDCFFGKYRDKQVHESDWDAIIGRARRYGVQKFLFAAGTLPDAKLSLKLSIGKEDYFSTIGVHPCRALEPLGKAKDQNDPSVADQNKNLQKYFKEIREVLRDKTNEGKLVAIGECGLDYDRFDYADKESQLQVFPLHFELTEEFKLPMYLHSRSTNGDFLKIIKDNRHRFPGGVVHSFDGSE